MLRVLKSCVSWSLTTKITFDDLKLTGDNLIINPKAKG